MSTKDYSAEPLKMEGVQIENLEEIEEEILLQISMERKMHICKRCGGKTDRIHDYRVREVRDLELRGKPVRLLYRRRRYACPACGKRFSETNDFVGRYMRFTHRTAEKIMELLRRRSSMKDIAKDTGISVSGVKRVLGIMPVSKPQRLPQALSFDEFKGDTGGQPFQCIVADPLNRRVFDILPDRTALTIQEYLRSFPNRDEVKCVVMDMNRGFRNIARTFLPNAQIIIDRFHVVRCCTEAMENARRSFQSSLSKEQRRYFKRSRRLLLAHRDRLSDEDRAAADVMLRFSDRLLQAYALKEAFYHFMDAPRPPDRAAASRLLARCLRPTRTSRIQILPQDVAQLEALHTQRFRFSPVQWVYRGLQQRNQDTQKGRLRVQKLPFLQGEDSALAESLPQHLTKSPFC